MYVKRKLSGNWQQQKLKEMKIQTHTQSNKHEQEKNVCTVGKLRHNFIQFFF